MRPPVLVPWSDKEDFLLLFELLSGHIYRKDNYEEERDHSWLDKAVSQVCVPSNIFVPLISNCSLAGRLGPAC